MRGRRLAIAAGVTALVIVVLAGAWMLLRDDSNPVSPLPPEQALPAAERACSLMRQFEAEVIANAQAKVALATLDNASASASIAARADVVWVPLDGGIKAVRAGFRKNDGEATEIGIRVVRNACTDLAPPAPGP